MLHLNDKMTRRACVQRAILGTATAAFALWIIGAAFLLLTAGRSRPGVTGEDTASNPNTRLLSPVEKRLTHLANLVSELRQEIGYRRRRVAESDEKLTRLKAQLDGPLVDAPAVRAPQHSAELNPKRHLMDVHNTLDPISPATHKTTRSTHKRGETDKGAETHGANEADSPTQDITLSNKLVYGCKEITSIPHSNKELIGSGFTKQVHKALFGGKPVAIKTPLTNGQDVTECIKYGMGVDECFRLANFKMLKEIAMLQQLQHPNIIKMLGFCLPGQIDTHDSSHTTTMITEYGEPITFLDLLKMSWEDRLRISLGVSRLLFNLSNSSVGSLSIHDFKPSQFVRVDGEIKLVDLDDVDDKPTTCRTPVDCALDGSSSTAYLPCIAGTCLNYSDRMNVYSAYKIFFTLLPYETPPSLRVVITNLVNKTGEALIGSEETYQELERILQLYRSGAYLKYKDDEEESFYTGTGNAYEIFADIDLPHQGDFWCTSSLQMGGPSCVLTAFDENEAKHLCDQEEQCTAFIMTSQKTWTGRTVIYLKRGTGHQPIYSPGNTLYYQLT
ncbi:extracellular tyrosine-protein kinase PKDCC-like [Patiria miniata]|uniref:Protein kinase domain-containing protein n=1 Tax=Patiria miniata TaxID=46514 RepID=A0A914B8V8_PATMI|nr:extracellular tyrosine-protein kinase PKDCC-like [Patiria miniata]